MNWGAMRQYLWVIGLSITVLVLAILARYSSPYVLHILTLIVMWGAMASAFNLLAGYAGQVCFIPPLFVGIGAYTSTGLLELLDVSPWIGMLIGGIFATILGLGIGYLFFRYGLTDVYFALGTMACVMIGQTIFLNIPALGKAKGLYIIVQETLPWMMKFRDKLPYFYITLGYGVVVFIISYIVSRNKVGYWFQAIREDESAAEAIGVNIVRYKMIAILITAFLLGVGGTIWAQYVTFIDPYLAFHWEIAGLIIILMLAGGSSTVVGPFVGALILIPVREVIRSELGQSFPGAHMVAYGALLMVILLYMPGGFTETIRDAFDRLAGLYKERFLAQTEIKETGMNETTELAGEALKLIRSSTPMGIQEVSEYKHDRMSPPEVVPNGAHHQTVLELRSVTKKFGGLVAVSNLSFSVQRGAILGLVGPNGAGKTTTFNVMTGALVSTAGNVFLNDVDISGLMPHETCEIGLVKTFQNVRPFTNLSVLETTMIGSFLHYPNRQDAEQKAFEALKELGLSAKVSDRADSLTLADLKRLEIAKALATDPQVVLLDEAASGLTDVEIEELLDVLKVIKEKRGLTYVIIEHVMKVVMTLCDHIVVMNFGEKIAEGTPEEVSTDPLVLEAYLGTSKEIVSA